MNVAIKAIKVRIFTNDKIKILKDLLCVQKDLVNK